MNKYKVLFFGLLFIVYIILAWVLVPAMKVPDVSYLTHVAFAHLLVVTAYISNSIVNVFLWLYGKAFDKGW